MNPPTDRHDPNLPAGEWQAQERALRAERLDLDETGDDERVLAYRRVARALAQPLPDPLPADFAERLAQRVASRRTVRDWPDRLLGLGLPLVLAVSLLVLVAWHGSAWWHALSSWLPAHVLLGPWTLSLAACLGLSMLFDSWHRHRPATR